MIESSVEIQKGHDLEMTIEDVTFGGQGVARVGGYVVMVSGAVTGDIVRARIVKKKSRFAEAVVSQVLKPSASRIESPCSHFGVCGGCKWLNIEYDTQLEFKRKNIEDVFHRIGGIDLHVPRPLPSPRLLGYRNKMEFTFGDLPWTDRKDDPVPEPFALGLHTPKNYLKVVDIGTCHLQSDASNRILASVKEFARTSGMPPYSVKTQEGFWRFLVIRPCVHTSDIMVHVITSAEDYALMQRFTRHVLAQCPEITSLIHGITSRRSQVAVAEHQTVLHGPSHIRERLGRYEFEISAGAFFQTNTLGAEELYRTVVQAAKFEGHELVYDLYCGTGTIALFISEHVRQVVGIEQVPDAVENARRNAIHNGVSNCSFLVGDIRRSLATLPDRPDVIILDPPRSGLHPDVVDQVISLSPAKIVYVSCDPSTQARDGAAFLKGGYTIASCQPVDMFPHTYHVENVIRLDRNRA